MVKINSERFKDKGACKTKLVRFFDENQEWFKEEHTVFMLLRFRFSAQRKKNKKLRIFNRYLRFFFDISRYAMLYRSDCLSRYPGINLHKDEEMCQLTTIIYSVRIVFFYLLWMCRQMFMMQFFLPFCWSRAQRITA